GDHCLDDRWGGGGTLVGCPGTAEKARPFRHAGHPLLARGDGLQHLLAGWRRRDRRAADPAGGRPDKLGSPAALKWGYSAFSGIAVIHSRIRARPAWSATVRPSSGMRSPGSVDSSLWTRIDWSGWPGSMTKRFSPAPLPAAV